MADKITVELSAMVDGLLSAFSQAQTSFINTEKSIDSLSGSMRRVRDDSEALEKAWGDALVENTKRAESAINDFVQALNQNAALAFRRTRDETEQLERAWGEALVEDAKRAQKATDALNKSLAETADAQKKAASEAQSLGKSWDAALVENAKRAETAAKEASQANIQAANAFRSPWQAVSAGLRLVESEFGLMGIAAIGATAAVIGIGAALYELVSTTGKAAIETDNLASRLGITDQQALKLQASSELAGISAHAFETNIRFLVEALDAGNTAGVKTLKAIQDLGIATVDTLGNQREMGQVFLEIIDKLSRVEDVNKRAAIAVEIFHRNAMQIIPLIKNYQDYNTAVGDMGIGAHEGLTAALRAQGEEVIKLNLAWENFKNEAAFTFGPIVTHVLDELSSHIKVLTIEVQALTGNFDQLKSLLISIGAIANPSLPTVKPIGAPEATTDQKAAFTAYISGQEEMKESLQKRATAAKTAWEAELIRANQLITVQHIQGAALDEERAKVANLRGEYVTLKSQLDAIKASEEAARKAKTLELETQRELNRLTEENIRGAGQVAEAWKRADEAGRNKKEGPVQELPVIDRSRSEEERAKGDVAIAAAAKDLKLQVAAEYSTRVAQIRSEESAHYELELNKQIASNDRYYAELQKKNEKAFTEGLIVQDRGLAAEVQIWKQELEEYNKHQADLRRAADEATVTLIESNNKKYEVQKAAIENQAKLFQLTPKQRSVAEEDASRKTYEANLDAANQNVNELNANPDASQDERARAEKRLTDVVDAEEKRRQAIIAEGIKSETQKYTQLADAINKSFDSVIRGMITHSQTFGQAISKLGKSLEVDFATHLANMLLKWIEFQFAQIAFQSTAAAAGVAIAKTSAAAQQLAAAKVAASNTYAAVSAIPIIGPILAPPAAAVAFAAVLAFEKGGLVPDDQMAFLHKNEMVLPAPISKGVQNMISNGGGNGGSNGGSSGNGSGGDHFHYHSSEGESDASIRRNSKLFAKHIQNERRAGRM